MNLSDLDAKDNAALKDIILDRIHASGPISFAEFYELAMYHPRHGYYFANDPTRDFQSSPNVHPVFGAAIARQLVQFWRSMDRPARFDVFEAGASSGRSHCRSERLGRRGRSRARRQRSLSRPW